MKIFGREPVYILAFVAVVLKLAAAYGLDVTDTQQTLINTALACVVALISAIVLKTGAAGAAILQLANAALALFLGFGVHISAVAQADWMAAVSAALAIVLHREVTAPISSLPIEQSSPVSPAPPVQAV